MLCILTCLLALTTTLGGAVTDSPPPLTKEITTEQGTIEGTRESIGESRFFYSFRGIPYAAPPVGDLRFKDPAAPLPWSGTRKSATPSVCPQVSLESFFNRTIEITGEEDCLYLHVYTPKPDDEAKLPVMVFIHGGGFTFGSPDQAGGGPTPLLKKDIVLVSIQYRLGTLGFLSTGDSVLPGNLGVKDQTAALKWVNKNIQKFGGNIDSVTIFGESAGSASVHYHIISPSSQGLFHGAIMHSGTVLNLWAIREDHAERAHVIAKSFNCPGSEEESPDSSQLLQCFMEKTPQELVMASLQDTTFFVPFYMVPRVDGDFLPRHPAEMLKDGEYNTVDVMAGLCQNEGASFLLMYHLNETVMSHVMDNFDDIGPSLIFMDDQEERLYLTRRVFYHYVGEVGFSADKVDELEKLMSDSMMNVGHDETTALHARDKSFGRRTYRYELQHRAQSSYVDFYPALPDFKEKWVAHADDLLYLFDNLFGVKPLTRPDDLFLSDIMVDLWTNFAEHGDPTPNMDLGFKWEPMNSSEDFRYLSITPAPTMKEDNRAEVRKFWRDLPLKPNKYLFPEKFPEKFPDDQD